MRKIAKEQEKILVMKIQAYFEAEMSDSIGELAATNLLDFMVKQLEPIIYNQAISDAAIVVTQQMQRVEEEIYALEQPLHLSKRR